MSAVPWGSQVGARQCLPADAPHLSHTAPQGSRGVQSGAPASLQGSGCAPAVWCAHGWGGLPRTLWTRVRLETCARAGPSQHFFFFFSLLTALGGRSVISTQRRDPNMNWLSLDHNINSQVKAVGFEHRQSRQLLTSHLFFTKSQRFTV